MSNQDSLANDPPDDFTDDLSPAEDTASLIGEPGLSAADMKVLHEDAAEVRAARVA